MLWSLERTAAERLYRTSRMRIFVVSVFTSISAIACISPAARFDHQAIDYGFTRDTVVGTEFSHAVYRNTTSISAGALHVYLGSDGLPWATSHRISQDPTPRRPLMLQLMALDDKPSIYLGRPCYHGLARTPPCAAIHWTHQRYSDQVVTSMASALTRISEANELERLVLFGYSGGGALAVLLAERLPKTDAVVTIAGNLDPDAWSLRHGFSELRGSLNPAYRSPLADRILQLHLAGTDDQIMPVELIEVAMRHRPTAAVLAIDGFDHRCCWSALWPHVLEALDANDWTGFESFVNGRYR